MQIVIQFDFETFFVKVFVSKELPNPKCNSNVFTCSW